MSSCPVPHCAEPVPAGPHALFCATHHCALPPREARFLLRWQAKTARCEDADTKTHMVEQLHGYVARAVRLIGTSGAQASQAAPDSARRAIAATGATYGQVRQ